METPFDATIEKRNNRRRLSLSQLLWIGVGALVLFPVEAMVCRMIEPLSNFWTNVIFTLAQVGVPLVVYCSVENLKLCAKPIRFILWLLLGGIVTALLNLILDGRSPDNYPFQLSYILLVVLSIDSIVEWRKNGVQKRTLLFPALLALTVCLHYLCRHMADVVLYRSDSIIPADRTEVLWWFFAMDMFPYATMGALIPLACVWYYAKKKRTQCWAIVGYGLLSVLVRSAQFSQITIIHNLSNGIIPVLLGSAFVDSRVFAMLAIPFILRYEQREGMALSLRKHGFIILMYLALDYAIGLIPAMSNS